MKNGRIFIVTPQYNEDTLYVVCKTLNKDRFLDIYQTDLYEEIYSTNNLKDALRIAKRHNSKRPAMI